MAQYSIEDSTLTEIADAIRSKTGGTGQILTEEMAGKIQSISGGGGGLDTSDANATDQDMPVGVTAYVNGVKVAGKVQEVKPDVYILSDNKIPTVTGSKIYMEGTWPNPIFFRPESGVRYGAALSNFGNARGARVLEGYTFTGADGLKQPGTMANNGAVNKTMTANGSYTIPEGYHDGSGKVTVNVSGGGGIDTSDATAKAVDMASDVTAYVNGVKVQGSATTIPNPENTYYNSTTWNLHTVSSSETDLKVTALCPSNYHFRPGGYVSANVPMSRFGDAVAADVAKGKFFTSSAGLKVEGTKEDSGPAAPVLQEKTVTPSTAQQTVIPDATYDGLSKVTVNAMPSAALATPTITVDSVGKITAQVQQTAAGYVPAGSKSATKQLTTKGSATITPGTANQTIASGTYLTGTQTIQGDANLKAANIKQGVSIFGVQGSFAGSGGSSGGGIPSTITAGDTPVLASFVGKSNSNKTTPADTGASITIRHAGTYRFKVPALGASSMMGTGSATVYLYKNGVEVASHTVSSSVTTMQSDDIACAAGDVISVWSMAGGSSYSTINAVTMGLIACVDWDNGF